MKLTRLYRHTVTAKSKGTGSGSISSTPSGISYNYPATRSGNGQFNHGSDVTLTATADPGSSVQWTSCPGSVGGDNSVATCTMNDFDGPKTAAATFTKLDGPDLAGNWETLKEQGFSFGKMKFYTVQGKLKVSNIGNRNSGSFKVAFYTSSGL